MPLATRALGAAAAFALLGWVSPARGQCLTGGGANICEDPLTGASPESNVVGGTLLPGGGFRVDAKGDHVTFDLGADAAAASVRFTISNVSASNLDQDTHLVLLATDTPELQNPAPKRVLELKIWGNAVDPAAQGITILGAGDGVQEAKKNAGKLAWNAQVTYTIDVSWDHAEQRLRLTRSGQTLLDFQTGDVIPGQPNPPLDLRYRYVHLAMPPLAGKTFWPVVKSVYGMASISATLPAGSGGAGGTDAGSSGGAAGGEDAGTSASGGSSGALGTGVGGAAPGSGGGPGKATRSEDEGGSGCRVERGGSGGYLWLALGLMLLRRRARNRCA